MHRSPRSPLSWPRGLGRFGRPHLAGLPADRGATHEQAWEEIHRSTRVYWEQAKTNGHVPGTLHGWETVAAMVDVSQHMLELAYGAAEHDDEQA